MDLLQLNLAEYFCIKKQENLIETSMFNFMSL